MVFKLERLVQLITSLPIKIKINKGVGRGKVVAKLGQTLPFWVSAYLKQLALAQYS